MKCLHSHARHTQIATVLWNRHQLLEAVSSRNAQISDCLRHRLNFTDSAGISTATNNYAAKGIYLYKSFLILLPHLHADKH